MFHTAGSLVHGTWQSGRGFVRRVSRAISHQPLAVSTVALAIVCLVAAGSAASGETIDRVLAAVAGDVITLSDVTAARDLGLVVVNGAADPVRAVLDKLIDRELVLAEVDRYAPPEPTAEAVDREVQIVRGRFPTVRAFEEALSRFGLEDRHLRQTLRDDLRIRAYLDQRFMVPPPNEDEVERYYQDHAAAFMHDRQLVPFAEARPAVVQALIAERRTATIDDWVGGLRRRADVTDLYLPGR